MNDRELMEQVEVVAYRVSHPLAQWKVYEQRQDWAYREYEHIRYEVQDLMTVAQHKRIMEAKPQSDGVMVPRDVVLFLTGEGALDGWFFEEQRPDQHIVGQYWWRKNLRALLGGEA